MAQVKRPVAEPGPLVITVDGPAGAGKSTVTKLVARRLGILYLDTGAMYRAATLAVLRAGVAVDDAAAVAARVQGLEIGFDAEGRVQVDGAVVEPAIRTPEVTREIWRVADNPACRARLVALQQAIIAGRDAALEGRDAGTVIAPGAGLKIFLDASVEERARRRLNEWRGQGAAPALAEVMADIAERDRRDRTRPVGALVQAEDALPVVTDGLNPAEVAACIIAHAVQRRPMALEAALIDQVIVGRSRQPGYVRVAEGSAGTDPEPWQLGLTNPVPDRLPGQTKALACNHGGRQAGVLLQGRAVLVLAGRGSSPGEPVALPLLPQTWYVIEPGAWHAVVQIPGTICAWAEASGIRELRADLTPAQQAVMRQYLKAYLRDHL